MFYTGDYYLRKIGGFLFASYNTATILLRLQITFNKPTVLKSINQGGTYPAPAFCHTTQWLTLIHFTNLQLYNQYEQENI